MARRAMLIGILTMAWACRSPEPDAPTVERPVANEVPAPAPTNVVLVTIDTLRADQLGAYGGLARTPRLDGVAGAGLLFERCFSASMLTNPSHASIMTSLYPRDHGVFDNESGIQNGVRTLAEAMRRKGLHTAAVISFPHLNPNVSNLGQGFERVLRATRRERRADETTAAALALLDERRGDAPFFLWVHYVDPHAPYDPPASHPPRRLASVAQRPIKRAVRAAPGFQRRNEWFKGAFASHRYTSQLVQKYVAEIEAADAGFGELIDGLAQRGAVENTLFVVTSDHGENLGERELYFHHGGLYEESVHVPLIVAGPGVPRGRVPHLVATVDIAPTVLQLMRAPRWEPMRGQSLLAGDAPRDYVYSEHMLSQLAAVRSADGALILHRKSSKQFPTYTFEAGRRELYDTGRDPREERALPASGELANELESALQRYLGVGLLLTARKAVDQDRESLRALGYIE